MSQIGHTYPADCPPQSDRAHPSPEYNVKDEMQTKDMRASRNKRWCIGAAFNWIPAVVAIHCSW